MRTPIRAGLVAAVLLLAAVAIPSFLRTRVQGPESTRLSDTRHAISATEAYRPSANGGVWEGHIDCLARPGGCLFPGRRQALREQIRPNGAGDVVWVDGRLTVGTVTIDGFRRTSHPGALVSADRRLATLEAAVRGDLNRVSQTLTSRIRELAQLGARVDGHLKKMGAAWK